MSYQKNYPNGWQSGEAGGTPITPAALDNMENGIANALPKDGTDPMTADLPMGGHRVTGLGEPVADGDAVPLGYANGHFAPAVESADYPGCYYRSVNGVVEWLNPPMVPGVLYRTTKRCEGKPVYTIRVDCGALPNDTVTNTPLNMSVAEYGADVKLVGIDYTVKHPDTAKPHHIGNPSYIDGVPMNCRLYSNGALYYCRFQTHGDLSAYTAVATLELVLGG